MNKEGFTLVELLAILVILGIIILVAMPALVESNRATKANEKEDFKEMVEMACNAYKAVNPSATSVTISDLKSGGYLKSNLTKPDGVTSDSVIITNEGCNYDINS